MAKKSAYHCEEIACETSSGNVFFDLAVENPEEEQTKARLVWEIEQIVKRRKWTQSMAAESMGINQPKVSALMRRKLDGFSIERLIHFLHLLGQDIDIIVRPKPRSRKQGVTNVFHASTEHPSGTIPLTAKGK